jgi:hypothetical protein
MYRMLRNWRLLELAVGCLIVSSAICLGPGPTSAAENADEWAQQATNELFRSVSGPQMEGLAFVFPPEYWDVLAAANGGQVDAERLRAVKSFIYVGVVEAEGTSTGQPAFRTEAQIRRDLKLVDARGRGHRPLAPDSMDAGLEELVRRIEHNASAQLGEVGLHVHIFAFRTADGDSTPIVQPELEGSLAVESGAARYEWQLPLASLVPPAVCPEGGETVLGGAKYCPLHGVELKRSGWVKGAAIRDDKARLMKDPRAI